MTNELPKKIKEVEAANASGNVCLSKKGGINMYIVMSVYAKGTLEERLNILKKFYPGLYAQKKTKGIILKFNNAIGFSKVVDQPCGDERNYWNILSPAGIKTDDSDESPYLLLMKNSFFFNKKNEVTTFVVENKHIYCEDERFSYNTMEIIMKFQKFLYKFFGLQIQIEFSFENKFELSHRQNLLSYFITCFAESEDVNNEIAVEKQTKKKDIKYITNIFKNLGYNVEFVQFFCETCASHHPDTPWHTLLEFN